MTTAIIVIANLFIGFALGVGINRRVMIAAARELHFQWKESIRLQATIDRLRGVQVGPHVDADVPRPGSHGLSSTMAYRMPPMTRHEAERRAAESLREEMPPEASRPMPPLPEDADGSPMWPAACPIPPLPADKRKG
jgi:hypothetical protein